MRVVDDKLNHPITICVTHLRSGMLRIFPFSVRLEWTPSHLSYLSHHANPQALHVHESYHSSMQSATMYQVISLKSGSHGTQRKEDQEKGIDSGGPLWLLGHLACTL